MNLGCIDENLEFSGLNSEIKLEVLVCYNLLAIRVDFYA